MYWAVHGPMPGNATQRSAKSSSVRSVRKSTPAIDHRARYRAHRVGASTGQADHGQVGIGQCIRCREQMFRVLGRTPDGNGCPKRCASLAASVRAAATLTCWPRIARTAISKPSQPLGRRRPGPASYQGRQAFVCAKHARNGIGIRVQVEHPAQPLHDIEQSRGRGTVQFKAQSVFASPATRSTRSQPG